LRGEHQLGRLLLNLTNLLVVDQYAGHTVSEQVLSGIKRATDDGVISNAQADRLLPYLVADKNAGAFFRDGGEGHLPAHSDTETPRFVRGFHDILITIGVIVVLSGLWGVASVFAVFPAIIVLAEILVRRQRLALPAVTLTVAMAIAVGGLNEFIYNHFVASLSRESIQVFLMLFLMPPFMAIFYWRYRVPLALAGLFLAGALLALVGIFIAVEQVTGSADVLTEYRLLSLMIFLIAALSLFALAMRYDLSDRYRVTRRSDIAFWLHLATAPALLYALLAFVFIRSGGSLFLEEGNGLYSSAALVVCVVVLLMLIGIIIDRRAFVTSGLVSLIATVVAVLRQGEISGGNATFAALFAVGVFVLVIGIGWSSLRRVIVAQLPSGLQEKLPPVI
jgi:MFS family permease